MDSNKIDCNSQANVVATKTVNWNIAGWEGPFKHLVRSQADFYVSLGNSPTETIDLRLYLRYVEDQNDPRYDPDSPMCDSWARFSGYSLMVDVLSEHKEKLMVSITARKSDNDTSNFGLKRGGFVVDPNGEKSGITAINVFARCELWREDDDGVYDYKIIGTNPYALDIPTSDKKIVLTVTSYKMENTGPDNPNLNQGHTAEVSELVQDIQAFQFEPDNHSDLVLTSEDGIIIRAHRFILAARSPYFNRLLKNGTTSLSLDVSAKSLLVLLHWIYTGDIQDNCGRFLGSVFEAAVKLEMHSFLKTLDNKLIKLATTENMFMLAEFAKTHGMKKAADDLAEFIKCNISTWLSNPCQGEYPGKIDTPKTSVETADTNSVEQVESSDSTEVQHELASSMLSLNIADQASTREELESSLEIIEAGGNVSIEATSHQTMTIEVVDMIEQKKDNELYQVETELRKLNEFIQKLMESSSTKLEQNSDLDNEVSNAKRKMKELKKVIKKLVPESDTN